jgi:exodeoxyribonuclease VIII
MSTDTNTPQLIADLSNEEYHSKESISKSGLDLIHACPALFKHRRENPTPPTPALRMGSLTHTAILEPGLMAQTMIALPDDAPRDLRQFRNAKKPSEETMQAIEWWDEFTIKAEGKEIITSAEEQKLRGMRDAVWGHKAAARLLNPEKVTHVEASIFAEVGGVPVRVRPDVLRNDLIMPDLKTSRDASPSEFAKSVANYRYHVQAAFYPDVYELLTGIKTRMVFIVVETEPPYLVATYTLSEDAINQGRREYLADLATYRQCIETGTWPGYPETILPLDLPKWAMDSAEA